MGLAAEALLGDRACRASEQWDPSRDGSLQMHRACSTGVLNDHRTSLKSITQRKGPSLNTTIALQISKSPDMEIIVIRQKKKDGVEGSRMRYPPPASRTEIVKYNRGFKALNQ